MPTSLSSQRTSASIAISTGPNSLHEPVQRARHRQRDAVGRVERRGLRQDFGEHDDQDGHHHGGVDHAGIAEPGQQHAGRQRRGGDIDRVVAEQQRAEQPLALLEQAVDDAGALVAVLFQPRHAGARRRGQRRLAAGEESRQQQAEQHNDEREPVVRGHRCGKLLGEERAHLGGIDVACDKGLADAAHQDEGELAALDLLVLRDQVHQAVDARQCRRDCP